MKELEKTRLSVATIESEMLEMPQAECSVVHTFGPGLYIRELFMQAGIIAIGHHQKFDHMNIFLKGKVLMLNDDGTKTELSAPMMFVGKPGRKIGYVIEDVTWLNVYSTNETDIETLEATYLTKSKACEEKRIKLDHTSEIEDYKDFLIEFNVTEDEARNQAENKDDQIPMPYGSYKVGVFKSDIEGRGVFATARIEPGEILAPARLGDKRTPIGRYTNHSHKPNAKMEFYNGDIYLVATTGISGCQGGRLGDEITTNYRDNVKLLGDKSCQQLQRQ